MEVSRLRNFAIIAHIDHGKSTLADRLLERTGTLDKRASVDQFLDKMDLERERGITIKAQTVRMTHGDYVLNLIDTPGHVDFHYEVSRSLAACEGALLVVDAAQGVEAQTVANAELAVAAGLEVIPVLNKIDLPNADPESACSARSRRSWGSRRTTRCFTSRPRPGRASTRLLEAIVERMPAARRATPPAPLRALVFDSWYDPYQGGDDARARIKSTASLRQDTRLRLMATGDEYDVDPARQSWPRTSWRSSGRVWRGRGADREHPRSPRGPHRRHADRRARAGADAALPGFQPLQPMVWSGLYPSDPAPTTPCARRSRSCA